MVLPQHKWKGRLTFKAYSVETYQSVCIQNDIFHKEVHPRMEYGLFLSVGQSWGLWHNTLLSYCCCYQHEIMVPFFLTTLPTTPTLWCSSSLLKKFFWTMAFVSSRNWHNFDSWDKKCSFSTTSFGIMSRQGFKLVSLCLL